MAWTLHDHLRYAVSQDRGIFLDLSANRYFALPDALDRLVRHALAADDPLPATHAEGADLARRGLLRWRDAPVSSSPIERPVAEAERAKAISPVLAMVLLAAQSRATRDVKHAPLRDLTASWPSDKDVGAVETTAKRVPLAELAATARALARLLPSERRCLPHSLAFVRTCRRYGSDARLVIGVSGAPFAAHCWAQAGGRVLNDRLERVQTFTPIAAWG